jgi:glycine cleavage system pyridoxal-binding protein P
MRPTSVMTAAVLAFGQSLGSAGNAGGTEWLMFSPTDNVTRKIESISCDNEWDTQRRRGLRATLRTRQDVQ